ncbi:Cytochrome c oxidase subunit 2 [BD1-7 clade bacterium]|uniref:Cytochrome c oxidase subunit 2 n=1 Tax=BD1-7 clade bacterium TaxID=2029982 RepID=A0A5S9QTB8_9GAMM|nr:Cytochrome c oxidase subunit 2 [BD1-7 clade bacterium]CAA0122017.1 Cytochrome c oxidase subunit 2 [BD1-7 clade bacterium]
MAFNCIKWVYTANMDSLVNNYKIRRCLAAGLLLLAGLPARAEWQLNMTPGVTPISRDVFDLHMIIMGFCLVIAIIVYGALIYSMFKFRHSKYKGDVGDTHEHLWLEIVWTVIPFFILAGMAWPATNVLIRMNDFSEADVTVKVTGSQWKWQYEYLDQNISFFSRLKTPLDQIYNQGPKTEWYLLEVDNPVVLPINQKVRFLVTSTDVIHSWWVPAFSVKRDAIPGFLHEAVAYIEEPGTYRGQCAELCGVNHGFMPIVVQAVSQPEFDSWVAKHEGQYKYEQAVSDWNMMTALDRGKQVYEQNCAGCHGFNGEGIGKLFPALKGSSVAVGGNPDEHIDLVLRGVKGSAMQSYANQLTDADMAAVITYERNAWENNTGDLVTPDQVKKRRQAIQVVQK